MDILESFIGRFRKKEQKPKTISEALEGRFTPKVWTSQHFIEYLMALGRSKNFLIPTDQYPDLIELSEGLHKSLEDMRVRTSTSNYEYYSVVGFTTLLRRVSVPKLPLKGNEGQVPPEIIKEAHSLASNEGIDKIVGDIHSHPRASHLAFSLGDLYGVVYPNSTNFVNAVVGQNENLFVFKSKDTTTTGLDKDVLTQGAFCRFWYEQNGYRFLGHDPKKGEMAEPVIKNAPSIWELNLKVAKRHNLVFYEGETKTDLVKVFPFPSKK